MPRSQPNRTVSEVLGLALLGLGILLFLALISYTRNDVWFYHSPANRPALNFIGPIGAIVAAFFYFLFGAASYLIAVTMLGFGGAKLLSPQVRFHLRIPWVVAFVISGACLLHLWQPGFLKEWRQLMHIHGPGGWFGYWLGERVFQFALGHVGSVILLGCAYFASLVMLTGIQPARLVRSIVSLPALLRDRYQQFRLARADERERLVLEEKRVAREARKIERALSKKGFTPPASAESLFDEDVERPEPQVIDTSVPAPKKPEPKPRKEKLEPMEPAHFENYVLPELTLLDTHDHDGRQAADPEELRAIQAILIDTLAQFGISVAPGDITKGPTITRYEVYPAKGVRVDKILALERDLARATSAERINILAPIPGKDTVGIEIANSRKLKVTLREVLDSEDWAQTKARIPLALGKDVYGKTIIADLAQMPHCLVAGTTGSGKSVCINAMIASILYRFTPEEMRFIMIDPKVVELQVYNKLPHLVIPVVNDPKKVLLALRWVIDEMEKRYRIFATCSVRNITSFNGRPKAKSARELEAAAAATPADAGEFTTPEQQQLNIEVPRDEDVVIPEKLPYIVVIIDELADLMQTAPADVESAIARITQMARAAGIHMIVATQTPRADVVTGVIKANIPSRISFQVASRIDSRVILDENGAERLLGQGDMLYLPPGTSRMTRAQGVLVTDEEIKRLVDFVSSQGEPAFETAIHERLQGATAGAEEVTAEDEELVQKCIDIMRQEKKASTSLFQRRLRLGYTRAARVVDILEQRGYVAPGDGAKPREILKDLDALVH